MKSSIEKAYEKPEKVPWYKPETPKELVELFNRMKPCRVLDVGCGTGDYSIYLAKKGFKVTGIDISRKAIGHAQDNAKKSRVNADFKVLDALNLNKIGCKFDFVLEWGLLNFISFDKRKNYVKSISNLLDKRGKYLSFSFDISSPEWGGGRIRKGIATKADIYYSSMDELKELFNPYFRIIEAKKKKTFFENSGNEHVHNYLLMEKR